MTELNKFCPFCRHEDAELKSLAGKFFAVCCPKCQASGSLECSEEKAIKLWNTVAAAYIEVMQC